MNTLLKLDYFFILLGATLIVISIMSFRDTANPRRFATGGFWALYAIIFLVGEWLPPIMVGVFEGNPAIIAAIGMFSGYCGTLMTPMAANFNIVPAALLELPEKNDVVKVQVMTALPLLAANIALLYILMNRF